MVRAPTTGSNLSQTQKQSKPSTRENGLRASVRVMVVSSTTTDAGSKAPFQSTTKKVCASKLTNSVTVI